MTRQVEVVAHALLLLLDGMLLGIAIAFEVPAWLFVVLYLIAVYQLNLLWRVALRREVT